MFIRIIPILFFGLHCSLSANFNGDPCPLTWNITTTGPAFEGISRMRKFGKWELQYQYDKYMLENVEILVNPQNCITEWIPVIGLKSENLTDFPSYAIFVELFLVSKIKSKPMLLKLSEMTPDVEILVSFHDYAKYPPQMEILNQTLKATITEYKPADKVLNHADTEVTQSVRDTSRTVLDITVNLNLEINFMFATETNDFRKEQEFQWNWDFPPLYGKSTETSKEIDKAVMISARSEVTICSGQSMKFYEQVVRYNIGNNVVYGMVMRNVLFGSSFSVFPSDSLVKKCNFVKMIE